MFKVGDIIRLPYDEGRLFEVTEVLAERIGSNQYLDSNIGIVRREGPDGPRETYGGYYPDHIFILVTPAQIRKKINRPLPDWF